MADTGNSENHLESEIAAVDGVVGAIVLRDPDGQPSEVQIFSRTGASSARIRNGVADVLAHHEHSMSPDAISVFELTGEAAGAVPRMAAVGIPALATATAGVAGPAIVTSGSARRETESERGPPRVVPVTTLFTTVLAIVGLVLLLTAPWFALVRLVSQPLDAERPGPTAKVVTGKSGGRTTVSPPIVAAPFPTVPTIVAQPPATAAQTRPIQRIAAGQPIVPSAPTLIQIPATEPAPAPLSPPPTGTIALPPAPTIIAAPQVPSVPVKKRGAAASAISTAAITGEDESEDEEGLPPGHIKHHLKGHPGHGIGLEKHQHLEAVLPGGSGSRRDERDDEDDDD